MNCSGEYSIKSSYRNAPLILWSILAAGIIWSLWRIDVSFPRELDWRQAIDFFSYALRPALDYQAEFVPDSVDSLSLRVLAACGTTITFAAAGVGVALLASVPLALFSSTAFWRSSFVSNPLSRIFFSSIYFLARSISTVLRSIHELMWAVLFLAAFGFSEVTAVFAIALPYAGVFGRVFADIIDETDVEVAEALEQTGSRRVAAFVFGILPLAIPNMAAYTLYRFECGLRSSAILGFFGIPTLGFYISNSFENLYYGEVWSYLYGLFFLILIVDFISHSLRRRIVS